MYVSLDNLYKEKSKIQFLQELGNFLLWYSFAYFKLSFVLCDNCVASLPQIIPFFDSLI